MKIQAKKSLGQHFLNSPSVLAKIMSSADIKSNEIVLEIGPGTGILTSELLKVAQKVIAVEKDKRTWELLKQKYSKEINENKLELIEADILETELGILGLEEGKYALVANIPYYITGAILELFLEHGPRPNRLILLVQKEVAERIVATDAKESILSLSVKVFGQPKIISKVPKGAFLPPPTVDSAILEISNIHSTQFSQENTSREIKLFFTLIKSGFSHKRKLTIRNLEAIIDPHILKKVWINLNLDNNVRSEDISLQKWLQITKEIIILSPKSP